MIVLFSETKIFRRLSSVKHGVIVLLGTGQHGKTVSMHALLASEPLRDRNVAMINYPKGFVAGNFPSRYRSVRWPEELDDFPRLIHPSRDVVAIDDAAWLVGARDHATSSNKDLQKLLTIASHHELFFVLTIQNSSMLDILMMQSQDIYLFHKHMDPLSLEYERPMIKTRQVVANTMLSEYSRAYPELHPKGWLYCTTTWEMVYNEPPDWWQPKLSKPYYGVLPG